MCGYGTGNMLFDQFINIAVDEAFFLRYYIPYCYGMLVDTIAID